MTEVVYQDYCSFGLKRGRVILARTGLYEQSWFTLSEPTGSPSIPLERIRSVRIDSISFILNGATDDGKLLIKTYYATRTGLWADAFARIGITTQIVGRLSRRMPWDSFPCSPPLLFIPASIFFILALIAISIQKGGSWPVWPLYVFWIFFLFPVFWVLILLVLGSVSGDRSEPKGPPS